MKIWLSSWFAERFVFFSFVGIADLNHWFQEKDAELQQNAHTEKNPDNTEISNLDLTGTPLQTDLGGDDSMCGDLIAERPPSWTVREAKQHPLTLIHAR